MMHFSFGAYDVTWGQLRDAGLRTVLMPDNYALPDVYPRLMTALHRSKSKATSFAMVKSIAILETLTIAPPNTEIIPGVTANDMVIWCMDVSKHPRMKEFIQAVIDNRNNEAFHPHAFDNLQGAVFVHCTSLFWGFAAAGIIYINIDTYQKSCQSLKESVAISDEELKRVLRVALGATTIHEYTHVGFRQAIGNLNLSTPKITRRPIPESGFDTVMKAFNIPTLEEFIDWFAKVTYQNLAEKNLWVQLEESFLSGTPFPDLSAIISLLGHRNVSTNGFQF